MFSCSPTYRFGVSPDLNSRESTSQRATVEVPSPSVFQEK